jgi:hypothetical protein
MLSRAPGPRPRPLQVLHPFMFHQVSIPFLIFFSVSNEKVEKIGRSKKRLT